MSLSFERLEDRCLLSATAVHRLGILTIAGNGAADDILVQGTGTLGRVAVYADQDGDGARELVGAFDQTLAIVINSGDGDDVVRVQGLDLSGGLTINAGNGVDDVQVSASILRGGLVAQLGSGNDRLLVNGGTQIIGNVTSAGGAGHDVVQFEQVTVRGAITAIDDAGDDTFRLQSNANIIGAVVVRLGSGNDVVQLQSGSEGPGIGIGGAFVVFTGSGDDTVTLAGQVRVIGFTTLNTGGAGTDADRVRIGDAAVPGTVQLTALTVSLGGGNDELRMANATIGAVAFLLGGGGTDAAINDGGVTIRGFVIKSGFESGSI